MSERMQEIVVVDVKIPFWSMLVLMVKWAIAAIPAAIILFLLVAVLMSVFAGTFHWQSFGRQMM